METVDRTLNPVLAPHEQSAGEGDRGAPPRLLRCLVISCVATRRRLIRAAAEQQAWEAIVCRDAGEFLRVAFKRRVPLVIVDLPDQDSPEYLPLRNAADRAREATDALVVVAGANEHEELWARKLGAWSYLSQMQSQRGFELVFSEAQSVASAESRTRTRRLGQRFTPRCGRRAEASTFTVLAT